MLTFARMMTSTTLVMSTTLVSLANFGGVDHLGAAYQLDKKNITKNTKYIPNEDRNTKENRENEEIYLVEFEVLHHFDHTVAAVIKKKSFF